MRLEQVRALKAGDKVIFNDPNPEYEPKVITITSISFQGDLGDEGDSEDDIVYIASEDGSDLECLACELAPYK